MSLSDRLNFIGGSGGTLAQPFIINHFAITL